VGGKTTKSDSRANATQEVNKKLNDTNPNNPKSFFMDKYKGFQSRNCGKMGKMK
jgi:hypothetical protein